MQTISAFAHPLLTLPLPGGSSQPPKGFSSITFEKNKLETPNFA